MRPVSVLAMIPQGTDPARLREAIKKIDAQLAIEVERLQRLKKRKQASAEVEEARDADATALRKSIYMLDAAHRELWGRMTAAETQKTRAQTLKPQSRRR
jgi:hypothetical protein